MYAITGVISVQELKEGLANALEASINEEQGIDSDIDGDDDDDDHNNDIDDDCRNILKIAIRKPNNLC